MPSITGRSSLPCIFPFLDSMAAVGAAATAASRAEVLHESLDLRVDLEKREVKGHATVWVLLPPLPAGEVGTVDEGVFDYRLHARQMEIHEVKVNDLPASYMYPHPVDLLRDFVPPGSDDVDDREESGSSVRMDGEALDLHYRCQLIASQEDRTTDIFTLDMVVAVVSPVSSERGEAGNGDDEDNDREGSH
eukprot:evm.model.NODE_43026_length_43751_cov_20.433773.1